MESIEVPGIGEIRLRRSANIKYLRLRMAPGRGVWVSVPWGVSGKEVMRFIEKNREWILSQRRNMEVYEQDTGVGLGVGVEVQTKLHRIRIAESEDGKPGYRIEGEEITLAVPKGVDFRRVEDTVRRFLTEVYRMEAKRYLPPRVKRQAERFGFKYGRLTFRDNVSNWGSCSFDNNISLNIKLMKLPDELIDYVILHELCHTVEKNHSAEFWRLVGKVCPGYAELRVRLKKYHTRI